MLKTAGFRLPTKVHIHGFLTVDGEKMSKSQGTFVRRATYLKHLDPAYLRYYYASKLGAARRRPRPEPRRVRGQGQLRPGRQGREPRQPHARSSCQNRAVAKYPDDGGLFAAGGGRKAQRSPRPTRACDYARAMRQIMGLADRANSTSIATRPGSSRNDPARAQELQDSCTVALNLFRQLVVYLSPVLAELAQQTEELLGRSIKHWDDAQRPLVGTPVRPFQHMMKRVEPAKVQAMIHDSSRRSPNVTDASRANAGSDASGHIISPTPTEALANEPLVGRAITIDDFTKVDLRVARVVAAEEVPKAKKLVKLTL